MMLGKERVYNKNYKPLVGIWRNSMEKLGFGY